jgi:hypothetical protein
MFQCELSQGYALNGEEGRRHDQKTRDPCFRHCRERSFEVVDGWRGHYDELDPELFASGLDCRQGEPVRGRRRVPENPDPPGVWYRLRQYLQLLGDEFGKEHRQPRDISTGTGETRHVPHPDWIGMVRKHDRDCFGGSPGGLNLGRRIRKDDINIHANKFGSECRQLIHAVGPSKLNDNVPTLGVAEVPQAFAERLHAPRVCRSWSESQKSNGRGFVCLLRAHPYRPPFRRAG